MTFSSRIYSISLMCFGVFSAATIAQTPTSRNLVLNQPIEREIKGGESQFYAVNIGANQTAKIEIVQNGVDVSLATAKPSGEIFIETETLNGVLGNDSILAPAAEASWQSAVGSRQLAVSSLSE